MQDLHCQLYEFLESHFQYLIINKIICNFEWGSMGATKVIK